MKRLVILFITIFFLQGVEAQKRKSYSKSTINWLSFSPRAGYGAGLLINDAVFNDFHIEGQKRSPSSFVGARLGLTHGDNIGISFIGGKTSFTQNYSAFEINNIDEYTKSYIFDAWEYGAMLRITSDLGFIVELGPRFVKLNSLTSNIGGDILLEPTSVNLMDTTVKKYTTINLAIGQSVMRSERTELNISINLSYGLQDLFNETGFAYIEDEHYNAENPDFFNYYRTETHTTKPLTVMLNLEFNYFFAFWGDASCGKGKFMMFQ